MEQTRENTTKPPQGITPGDRQEFETLLKEYDVALLTTRGTDGHFHTRPMALSKKRKSGSEIWFATWVDTQKVHDLETDPVGGRLEAVVPQGAG